MPRHIICDAHEWVNEIFSVFKFCLVKLQLKERFWYFFFYAHFGQKSLVEYNSKRLFDMVDLYI